MRTKNLFSNVLKKLAPIALASTMLVACGKNNKVGGPGGPGNPGIFNNGISGMYAPGSISYQGIDQYIQGIQCQQSQNGQKIQATFVCSGSNGMMTCNRSVVGAIAGNVRLGRNALGSVFLYKDISPNQGELTLFICQDAIFNQSNVGNMQQVGIKLLNQYVSMNGSFGNLLANIVYPQIPAAPSTCSLGYSFLCDAIYGVR